MHNLDQEAKRYREEDLLEKFKQFFPTEGHDGADSSLLLAALAANKHLKWTVQFEPVADLSPLRQQLDDFVTAHTPLFR